VRRRRARSHRAGPSSRSPGTSSPRRPPVATTLATPAVPHEGVLARGGSRSSGLRYRRSRARGGGRYGSRRVLYGSRDARARANDADGRSGGGRRLVRREPTALARISSRRSRRSRIARARRKRGGEHAGQGLVFANKRGSGPFNPGTVALLHGKPAWSKAGLTPIGLHVCVDVAQKRLLGCGGDLSSADGPRSPSRPRSGGRSSARWAAPRRARPVSPRTARVYGGGQLLVPDLQILPGERSSCARAALRAMRQQVCRVSRNYDPRAPRCGLRRTDGRSLGNAE
jgi:hypothetical protein